MAESLCVAEADGACLAKGTTPTISIDSASLDSETNTTLTVVIQEAGTKAGGMRSLEFRRNSFLGAGNYKIVEDYQTALRDAIELSDTIAPHIWVDAGND